MTAPAVSVRAGPADQDRPSQPQVRIAQVAKTFRRRREAVQVLKDVSLDIAQGELLVLLGPSGCGKTTLLRCLVGLERPDGGTIELNGQRVFDGERGVFAPPNRRDVSMVFQNYALWPHMKVRRNVAYPLRARGLKDALRDGRVEEVLGIVQCEHLADRYPPELSGGQQQRVSLARALAPRPSVLLLDEPLSNLDALLRIELRAQLRLLHSQLGFTAVYVTHDQEEAIALGTRIAVLNAGRIEQVGPPADVYHHPATEYVADFLGARNRLEMVADGQGGAVIAGQSITGFVRVGIEGRFHLRLRDSHVTTRPVGAADDGSATAWLSGGRVIEVLPGAEHAEHVVQVGDRQLFARVKNDAIDVRPGDVVDIGLDAATTFCYDADSNLVSGWSARPL